MRSVRKTGKSTLVQSTGFGGHFRAVQGFRYVGAPAAQ